MKGFEEFEEVPEVQIQDPFEKDMRGYEDAIKFTADCLITSSILLGWLKQQLGYSECIKAISSVSVYPKAISVHIADAFKASKLPVKFGLLFGPVKKTKGWDGKSISLVVKVPPGHPSGLNEVTIYGYLPETCKLVETRKEVSEERRKQIQDELNNGTIVFKTECESTGTEDITEELILA